MTEAQKRASNRYEAKRQKHPRFGGRCDNDEKSLLVRMKKAVGANSEKELIIQSVRRWERSIQSLDSFRCKPTDTITKHSIAELNKIITPFDKLDHVAQAQFTFIEKQYRWPEHDWVDVVAIQDEVSGRMLIGAIMSDKVDDKFLKGCIELLLPICIIGGTESSPLINIPYRADGRLKERLFLVLTSTVPK